MRACTAVDRLQKDVVVSTEYRRYWEGYPWFALAALACWATALLFEATVWRQVP